MKGEKKETRLRKLEAKTERMKKTNGAAAKRKNKMKTRCWEMDTLRDASLLLTVFAALQTLTLFLSLLPLTARQ